ncbi:unnamed protein product [Dovyalis caffra]|uniref:Uncharacterized protein n=1 Tax=Dovyalis caffra TaxID=77055 RepID=A0AAV1QZD9_9ROSI|nr:unnamed protein product [Dovyalis caffra]
MEQEKFYAHIILGKWDKLRWPASTPAPVDLLATGVKKIGLKRALELRATWSSDQGRPILLFKIEDNDCPDQRSDYFAPPATATQFYLHKAQADELTPEDLTIVFVYFQASEENRERSRQE